MWHRQRGEPQRVVRSTRLPGRHGPSAAISSAIWRWRCPVLAGVEGMPCCYRISAARAGEAPPPDALKALPSRHLVPAGWPDGRWAVLVQRVLMPGSGRESWTLLGDDGEVVEPAERYLAYLAAIERSPNTVRAYAVSLKLWFEFLRHAAVGWDEAGVEDVARFVAWLRAPAGNVIVLADGTGARRPATVNRYLAGVFGFYDHHARTGVQVAAELVSWRRVSRGSYKPFLHHVTKGRPIPVRPVKLHVPRQCAAHLGAPSRSWRSWRHVSTCGTGSCCRCWPRPGCGSARRWGCVTAISSPVSGRCTSFPGRTTRTGRGRRCARPRWCRSRRRWCACIRSTCTSSTAASTPTTCS